MGRAGGDSGPLRIRRGQQEVMKRSVFWMVLGLVGGLFVGQVSGGSAQELPQSVQPTPVPYCEVGEVMPLPTPVPFSVQIAEAMALVDAIEAAQRARATAGPVGVGR